MKQTNERLCALAQKGDAAALDSLIALPICFMSKTRVELTILKQGFLALAAKTTEEMI